MVTIRHPMQYLLAAILAIWLAPARGDALSLESAETIALGRDPGYTALTKQSEALVDKATADSRLPDPMLSVGWLNLPVEDFDLHQEPMNQVRVAIKQTFPAGDTLAIRKNSALAGAGASRQRAAGRLLSVLVQTRKSWLEVQYDEAALSIVKRNEPLFRQLREVTGSLYATGKKALNDVVRADLELQRLRDREIAIAESSDKQRAMLARWVGGKAREAALPAGLPGWNFDPTARTGLSTRLLAHPLVLAMDNKVEQMRAQVALARQQYKPSWTIELGYSFRNAQRANGAQVSDLASIGASINLPLFTENRQDKRVSSANAQLNAVMDQRVDLLNSLTSRLEAELVRIERLDDRIELHRTLIIPQAKEQVRAALMAYKANRADFTEVMRAYIAQLDSILTLRRLQTDRLESIATIWYLLPPAADLKRTSTGDNHEQ